MIVFLLLVIIAILLFGSSTFLGAVGAVLGGLVAIVAVGFGMYLFDISSDTVIICVVGLLVLLFWFSSKQRLPEASARGRIPIAPAASSEPTTPEHVRLAIESDRRRADEYRTKVEARRKLEG